MTYFTWYGTNSIKLTHNKKDLLIDPFIRYDKKNETDFKNNFTSAKNILITHGHIDHTLDINKLYNNKNVNIYLTNCVYKRLSKLMSKNKLKIIKPGDGFDIDDFKVNVLKGKHIKFDFILIVKTLFNKNIIKYFKNLCYLIFNHLKCKEKNETVIYHITVDNLKIMILGSLGLDDKTSYPKDIDYLFLAFQGNSNLEEKAQHIIAKVKPKNVVLTHFDNSFPPLSADIDTSKLCNYIDKNINIIIPIHDKRTEMK